MRKIGVAFILLISLFLLCCCYKFEARDIEVFGINDSNFTLHQVDCELLDTQDIDKLQVTVFRIKNRTKFIEDLKHSPYFVFEGKNFLGEEYFVFFYENNYYYIYEYRYKKESKKNVFALSLGQTVINYDEKLICVPLFCHAPSYSGPFPAINLSSPKHKTAESQHDFDFWQDYYGRFTNGICEIDSDSHIVKVKGYVGEIGADRRINSYQLSEDYVIILTFTETTEGSIIDVSALC